MKFVSLYKGITLTVQGKYAKCTRLLIGFVWFLNNLNLTLRRILIVLFFFFLSNYVIKTFSTKINIGNKIKINHIWIIHYK